VPDVLLAPRSPAAAPLRIHLRDRGAGPPVVVLHGGWGYEAYPFDAALDALSADHRVLAPDRAGYGRSDPHDGPFPSDFHVRMAEETVALLDALDLPAASLWGHSDGAVIAAWMGILFPRRVRALVLEALHVVPAKRASVEFFRSGIEAPEGYGAPVVDALVRDHGPAWREVVAREHRAWLDIIAQGERGVADLYGGRLGEIRAPVLILHGRRDPRTEPGELDAALRAMPHARLELLDAGHSPHTGAAAAAECVALAAAFLRAHRA
jgi:3-oxoadipate enol-lactonase